MLSLYLPIQTHLLSGANRTNARLTRLNGVCEDLTVLSLTIDGLICTAAVSHVHFTSPIDHRVAFAYLFRIGSLGGGTSLLIGLRRLVGLIPFLFNLVIHEPLGLWSAVFIFRGDR